MSSDAGSPVAPPEEHGRYYETLVEASPTAIVACDTQLIVTSWNPAAERLFGYTATRHGAAHRRSGANHERSGARRWR